ncbi:hypothetical protein M413DRAFT_76579 [Hebeloma cylindrosporum]|uniref:4'-phosphopantetheinyl transferase domain-containing protein n=1 Tax=Hebeloma cylindrosporum TaxID=76867 RepID=A0A0C3C0U8_HEBCY|nr:hypothetical protein M413DRAFT_76579 [Hebeloma cylindrosporum h7]
MSATILVWMLSLNREYSAEEYNQAYQLCRRCFPNERFRYQTTDPDSFRLLITQLLPVLMMRHRRVRPSNWLDYRTPTGKHWIDTFGPSNPGEPLPLQSIGYHLAYESSLCGMAAVCGPQVQVINIGLGIKQVKVEPQGTPIKLYFERLSHKVRCSRDLLFSYILIPRQLTRVEKANITRTSDEARMLQRLCILLALKESFLKATGQPPGFDYTRLEFDVPNQRAFQDGQPMRGWEFRIFASHIGVARGAVLKQEEYQCVCAFFTGSPESTFSFEEELDLEEWVSCINIDEIMAAVGKLDA